jgi:hypothetical protein
MHGQLNVKFHRFSAGSSGASQPIVYDLPLLAVHRGVSSSKRATERKIQTIHTSRFLSQSPYFTPPPSQHSPIDRHIITVDPEARGFISDSV